MSTNEAKVKARLKLELERWYRSTADEAGYPPNKRYLMFRHNVIDGLVASLPTTYEELIRVKYVGPVVARRYGPELLDIIERVTGRSSPQGPGTPPLPAGIFRDLPWAAEDEERALAMHAGGKSLKEVAITLGRTERGVEMRLMALASRQPDFAAALG